MVETAHGGFLGSAHVGSANYFMFNWSAAAILFRVSEVST